MKVAKKLRCLGMELDMFSYPMVNKFQYPEGGKRHFKKNYYNMFAPMQDSQERRWVS